MDGQCRIRIQVAKALLLEEEEEAGKNHNLKNDHEEATTRTIVDRFWSADTTVREVLEEGDPRILPLLVPTAPSNRRRTAAALWDCTTHPPRNLTQDLLLEAPADRQRQGQLLQGQTLFATQWFPSARLQVLPAGETPAVLASLTAHEDIQYNDPQARHGQTAKQAFSKKPAPLVEWKPPSAQAPQQQRPRPLPSEILQSARSNAATTDDGEDDNTDYHQALVERQKNRQKRAARERTRLERLQAQIDRLEETNSTSKKKTTTTQVRNMLVKSRATGRPQIQMPDRLHFKCLVLVDHGGDDDDETAADAPFVDYRYFSIQDTIGKVLSSFALPTTATTAAGKRPLHTSNWQNELLVPVNHANNNNNKEEDDGNSSSSSSSSSSSYRRLAPPNQLLRLYEAVQAGYLSDFGTLVIRFYDSSVHDAMPSVQHEESVSLSPTTAATTGETTGAATAPESSLPTMDDDDRMDMTTTTTGKDDGGDDNDNDDDSKLPRNVIANTNLARAVQQWEAAGAAKTTARAKTSKKKPSSSAAMKKVQQMQMKSKARGDSKRVKPPDRFFVQLVVASTATEETTKTTTATALTTTTTTTPIMVAAANKSNKNNNDHVVITSMTPVFVAKTDPISRIVRDCVVGSLSLSSSSYELLVPLASHHHHDVSKTPTKRQAHDNNNDDDKFRVITDTTMTLQQASQLQILESFGQLIVVVKDKKNHNPKT